MSWELASFLVIGAVLVAGFLWYERSRPPAQVVALVAALAALAIAGRVAFAAFPNVKPTTDIVIFAGYALGGAPGFAVGALAALVSNFWFGQGPWTPWQMVGWGLCGILGAALSLGGRNVGRLTLAAVCGFAGIAYGALLNFSLMATYGGELSWQHFLLLEGRAVPFDAAHAIGNVILALVAGPAMVRMLVRFRQRFEWGRRPAQTPPGRPAAGLRAGGIAALLLVSLALGALAPPHAAAAPGVDAAVGWMRSVQNEDGGWGDAPGEDSSAATTAWAMLGMAATGHNPLDVRASGHSPVDYLRETIDQQRSPGALARTILALESAGVDPRHFAGHNLVADLLGKRRDNGSYEGWPGSTAYAVIALRAAGADGGLSASLDWLRQVQNDDGGWGDVPGSASTADGTGAVMQALSPGSKASHRGLAYLRESQRSGGGFPLGAGGPVNTQSTAWAIQGILAAGGNPDSYRRGGASAPNYIGARQGSDGHYAYSKSSNQTPIWVTAYALVAMTKNYYPIESPPREPKPTSSPNSTSPSGAGVPVAPAPAEAVPVPAPESTGGASSGAPGPGGVGAPPERFATPGQSSPGASAEASPPGGRVREGSGTAEVAPPVSSSSDERDLGSEDDSSSSPLGAIVAGLLAGCLLFGIGLLARRGWMRWRYGL
jgi:squalene-hopene cyclase-like protein/prenyltransferase/squalene oxidase-like repeat protein